jgi:uncharacterized membrane protein
MNLGKKLAEWQREGLLDATSAERIRVYETAEARPVMLYAIAGLGAVTIGIGIVSVVAANWDGIGYQVKLALDVLLGLALGAGIFWADVRRAQLLREALIAVYYAFTLASLALLGQIYQLDTPDWVALVSWSALTAPLLLQARSWASAMLWLAGLSLSYYISVGGLAELVDYSELGDLSVTCAAVWAFLLLSFGHWPWLSRERPVVSNVFRVAGWALVVAEGLLTPMWLYRHAQEPMTWGTWACLGSLAALALGAWLWLSRAKTAARAGLTVFLGITAVAVVVGFATRHDDQPLLAASLQLALLAALAFTAAQLDRLRSFRVVTALIALRIVIIYFEVFGSMLNTGLSMIGGGVVTLLLAWLWKRQSPELLARLQRAEGA